MAHADYAQLIAAEAKGESHEGKVAVGAVVLNRVGDPRWPDTVEFNRFALWVDSEPGNNRPSGQPYFCEVRVSVENCTPYVVEREQCKSCHFNRMSCPGPALDAEGCRYYYPMSYPSDTVIYNEKAYTNEEKGLETYLTAEARAALELAHRALTDGMADVPAGERWRKCADMRTEAKRAIRQVLGMEAIKE